LGTSDAILVAIVALAFLTEATLGFGATVIAVALGSFVLPIDDLLPAFVMVNVSLSAFLLLRGARHVDRALLLRRVLPSMAVGFPIGVFLFSRLPRASLQIAFAVFVIALSLLELVRAARQTAEARPLATAPSIALLALGGVVHGAFATGGPPVVYVCGRLLADKRAFRATLSVVWLVMNLSLLAVYAHGGRISVSTLARAALLVPSLLVGIYAGERLHQRVPPQGFRVAVFVLLLAIGVVLLVRAV
jgi:hypothetical protein